MSKMPAPQNFPSQKLGQRNQTGNSSRNGDNNDESVDMEMSDDDATFGDDIGEFLFLIFLNLKFFLLKFKKQNLI